MASSQPVHFDRSRREVFSAVVTAMPGLGMKATRVDGVYSADPAEDASATRYEQLTFAEALQRDLHFMDRTAIALCRENDLPIRVFDMRVRGNILKAASGESVGTLVCETLD